MSSLARGDSHSDLGSHDRASALDLTPSEDFSIIMEGEQEESSRLNLQSGEMSNARSQSSAAKSTGRPSLNGSKEEWSEPLEEL